jgi:hypothetical protein
MSELFVDFLYTESALPRPITFSTLVTYPKDLPS